MPPVRRVRSTTTSPEDKESVRPPAPRRRQAAQAQQAVQAQHRRPVPRARTREIPPEKESSAPLLLRLLSWLGIILLCFVLGYLGTSWFMDFMSKKLLLKPENRIENQEDLTEFQEAESEREAESAIDLGNVQQISLNLYHVRNDTIAETRRNFVSRTREDNIRDAVEEILSLSEVPGKIKLLHVFRNNDTAFLDMPGQFASAIDKMGKRKSLLLLTGLVRTLQENFSPLSQIRFLIDSKAPKSGGEVNLAAPWKMPKKS